MDLLDSLPGRPRATFFILGWLARKSPDMVREIHSRGHEVASHGFGHDLCPTLPPKLLLEDLLTARHLLEDIIGAAVPGYRAPSFSVNPDVLELIREAGYAYDSSYNSFSGHGRYGSLDLSGFRKTGAAYAGTAGFFELPVSNLDLKGRILPLGGGGYFRLFPFALFRKGMEAVLSTDGAFVFYAHPWEFDPGQPRVHQASTWFKFRHYVNLHRTGKKLAALARSFKHARFDTLGNYIRHHAASR